ncbi:MAG TPA: hypothetical protein PLJ43_13970, partial [Chitinophagales bacterium]|nr:hypothetical protein [Chitinophagales bacterium]
VSFVELRYSPYRQLRCTGRISYFSTDSYASAIWAMEPNVQGILTSSVLYGQGMRYMIMAQYIIPPFCTISARFASDIRNEASILSNGITAMNDYAESRLHIQVDIGF